MVGLRYRKRTLTAPRKPSAVIKQTMPIMLLRLTFLVAVFHIPQELVLNLDEKGMKLFGVRDRGRAQGGRGANIKFLGANDKHQFTVAPIVTANGTLLDFIRIIWGGKTARCHVSNELSEAIISQIALGLRARDST